MSAILVVRRHIGGTVHRLCSVEADEAIEQPPGPIEGLGRVTGRRALPADGRGQARRRRISRIAGHQAVLPAGTAVGRPVVAGPYVAVDGGCTVIVGARDDDAWIVRIDRNAGLVLRPLVDAAVPHGRIRFAVVTGVASRLGVPRHPAVRAIGCGRRRYQADQTGNHGYPRPQETCAHLSNPPIGFTAGKRAFTGYVNPGSWPNHTPPRWARRL